MTRGLMLEIVVYNPTVDRYILGQVLLEFSPTGSIYKSYWSTAIHLDIDESDQFGSLVASFVCFFSLTLLFTYKHIATVLVVTSFSIQQWEYLRAKGKLLHEDQISRVIGIAGLVISGLGFWGNFETAWLLTALATSVVSLVSYNIESATNSDPASNSDHRVHLSTAASWYDVRIAFNAILVGMSIYRMIRLCYWSKRVSLVLDALSRGASDFVAFVFLFAVTMLAFAAAGHIIFGVHLTEFMNLTASLVTMTEMIFSRVDIKVLGQQNRFLGPLFFLCFFFAVTLVLSKVLIGILVYSIFEVKRSTSPLKTFSESILYMTNKAVDHYHDRRSRFSHRQNFKALLKFLKRFGTQLVVGDTADVKLCFNYAAVHQALEEGEFLLLHKKEAPTVLLEKQSWDLLFVRLMTDDGAKHIPLNEAAAQADKSWDKMYEWLDRRRGVPGQKPMYQIYQETYDCYDLSHHYFDATSTAMRPFVDEVLRSLVTVFGSLRGIRNLPPELMRHTSSPERKAAFLELRQSLDARYAIPQQIYLPRDTIAPVVTAFNVVLESALEDDRNVRDLITAWKLAEDRATQTRSSRLEVEVWSLEMRFISTLPLFRDRVSARVSGRVIDQSHEVTRFTLESQPYLPVDTRCTDIKGGGNETRSFILGETLTTPVGFAREIGLECSVFHLLKDEGLQELCACECPLAIDVRVNNGYSFACVDLVSPHTGCKSGTMNISYRVVEDTCDGTAGEAGMDNREFEIEELRSKFKNA
eukprot:TRINITY_DN2669_c0_g1_i1.p1 TRINITY_DN2669_c0_g1~~TRINITY_DN2669_c0_g1_i1.p1  ORF type:complete len:754 (-),score=191.75 TRINITY_DN2669_c0_g1_i1:96-2357(-)